jgi:hypothetical protein
MRRRTSSTMTALWNCRSRYRRFSSVAWVVWSEVEFFGRRARNEWYGRMVGRGEGCRR